MAAPSSDAEQGLGPSQSTRGEDSAAWAAGDILGANKILKKSLHSRAAVHRAIVDGLPYSMLIHFIDHAKSLTQDDVAEVVGISTRTLRRQKDDLKKSMPAELGSRTWMLAETLARASVVFGGREAAERWLLEPAMGLDGMRPIDLLRTGQGAALVNEFLERLEHGVYN